MSDPKTYPAPSHADKRAYRRMKEDGRARAAYRNGLPQGIGRLNDLLTEAESPWHAEVIEARILQVREQSRRKNHRRRAAARATVAEPDDALALRELPALS